MLASCTPNIKLSDKDLRCFYNVEEFPHFLQFYALENMGKIPLFASPHFMHILI